MAHYICKCGENLWNGLCPNDIQIHVFKEEIWNQAVKNEIELYLVDGDYDIWKCPECNRVYSFKNNRVDKMFVIEYTDLKRTSLYYCLCGEKSELKEYIAYTDVELDNYTAKLDSRDPISLLPDPPRKLLSCAKCNRFFLKEENQETYIVYKERKFPL
jgi:phage FluMu protein Com